jgi:hypothetical protein
MAVMRMLRKRMRRTRTTRCRGEGIMVLRVSRSSSGSDMLFQIREPLSALLQAGRLFHEVCVDAFASIQTDHLNFIRNNQDAIRMIKASGLLDAAAVTP